MQVVYGETGSEETKTVTMFETKSMKMPNRKTITFNNKLGNMSIALKYAEGADVLHGLPTMIAQYQVPNGKLKNEHKDQFSHEV